MDLSIIIPAYNEEGNIKDGALKAVNDYLIKRKYSWEVLIVDDASKDETVKLAEAFAKKHSGFRVLKEPHRGKGGTVIAGVLSAKGEIVLFTDMDQATPINQIEKFTPKFKEGYDVVIGSRGGRKGAPILRKIMAGGFVLLRTIILRLPYKDTQCGFKALKKDAGKKVFKKMKVFSEKAKIEGAAVTAGFDIELLYIARKLKLKVAEVPVIWHHKGTERVSVVKDSWQGLRDMMQVRINALLGKYKV
jgi:glycosyltransferase involved in cell wall biosynthesis